MFSIFWVAAEIKCKIAEDREYPDLLASGFIQMDIRSASFATGGDHRGWHYAGDLAIAFEDRCGDDTHYSFGATTVYQGPLCLGECMPKC